MVSPKCMNPVYGISRLHSLEPFIITLPLSPYDLNNVERDVKHQIIGSSE